MATEERKQISLGDRLYARLTLRGGKVTEFMIDTVASMTELLSELRYCVRGHQGLGQLYVRNLSRGWSEQRPLMLYAEKRDAARYQASQPVLQQPRQMYFPWETH